MLTLRWLNWRAELILLGLVGMEATWLSALFLTLAGSAAERPVYSALLVSLLLLLPAYLSRGLAGLRLAPRLQWGLMTAGLLLAMALIWALRLLPTGLEAGGLNLSLDLVLVLLLVLAAWWRGNTLAHLDVSSPNVVLVHFWIGLSVFFLVIVLGEALLGQLASVPTSVEPPVVTAPVLGFIPAYFLFSLFTLSLARIEEVVHLPESTASAPRPRLWVAIIAGAAALVVVAGLLVSLFFTGGGLAWSLGWVPPLLQALGQVLQFAGLTLATILAWLFSLVAPLFQWVIGSLPLGRLREVANQLLQSMRQFEQLAREMEENQASGELWAALAKYALVGAFILAVLLVSRILRRGRRGDQTLVPHRPEVASGLVDANKGDFLRQGLGRLADRLRERMRLLYALSIRHIYANLCRLATGRGHPRSPQQTPNEYQAHLVEAWPEHAADIQTITHAYVRAHYGAIPDSREELDRIRHAWRRIQSSV